jgi:hypothetical protein
MRSENRDAVEKLASAGIGFYASVATPAGAETVALSAREALAYLDDPIGLTASFFGLSVSEYEQWVALDGRAICGKLTAKGRRCRNLVSGRTQLPAELWKERHGEPCAIHGGERAVEAR